MSPSPLRSNFRAPTTIDYERVKRNGFHQDGILVVRLDDPSLSWADKILLEQIGARLYGPRPAPLA